MRYLFALLAASALLLSLGGVASAAVSKREFIRKGDVLCGRVKEQLVPIRIRAEAAKALPEEQKWVAVANIWADQLVVQRRFVRNFHAIGVPANDRRARALNRDLDRGLVLTARVQRAFAQRNTATLPTVLSDYLRFTTALNQRVRAYGFRVCGR